jgi:hypothetical protein
LVAATLHGPCDVVGVATSHRRRLLLMHRHSLLDVRHLLLMHRHSLLEVRHLLRHSLLEVRHLLRHSLMEVRHMLGHALLVEKRRLLMRHALMKLMRHTDSIRRTVEWRRHTAMLMHSQTVTRLSFYLLSFLWRLRKGSFVESLLITHGSCYTICLLGKSVYCDGLVTRGAHHVCSGDTCR